MASKHMVICLQSGQRFDVNRGGYYNSQRRRYTFKKCGKALKTATRKQRNGTKQSTGAMIAKIVIGALFVIAGFSSPDDGWTFGYFLTALLIGGGLILWGLYPQLKAYKKSKIETAQHNIAITQENAAVKVCASCGASGSGSFCEYCGTAYTKQ